MPESAVVRFDVRSDVELLGATRAGDESAFAVLWQRHQAAARRFASYQTGQSGDGEDLVSEAFYRVLRALKEGGGPDETFRPYLFNVIRRLNVDRLRAPAHSRVTLVADHAELELSPSDSAAEQLLARTEYSVAVQAWASLPVSTRTLLWHAVIEGEKPAQIGEILGVAPASLSSRLFRAKEQLRQAFLQQHVVDSDDPMCAKVRSGMGRRARRAPSARERATIDAHLAGCASCRAAVVDVEDVNRRLRVVIGPILIGGGAVATRYLRAARDSHRLLRRVAGRLARRAIVTNATIAAMVAAILVVVLIAIAPNAGSPSRSAVGRPGTDQSVAGFALPSTPAAAASSRAPSPRPSTSPPRSSRPALPPPTRPSSPATAPVAGLVAVIGPALAPPAPAAPNAVYRNDFGDGQGPIATPLASFQNGSLSADTPYRVSCDGVVVSFDAPDAGAGPVGCANTYNGPQVFTRIRQLAYALGTLAGGSASSNHALGDYTDGAAPAPNLIPAATTAPVTVARGGVARRFVGASVDLAATSCGIADPHFAVYVLDGGVQKSPYATSIDPCSTGTIVQSPATGAAGTALRVGPTLAAVGRYPSSAAVLTSGAPVGLRIRNVDGGAKGNDSAIDNLQLLDETPRLTQAFAAGPANTAVLRYTVTNTSDRNAKYGWSFANDLPSGLRVAGPAVSSCAGSITAGGSTVRMTGSLRAGQEACTISVPVTAADAGTFASCAANFPANVGVDRPACASVTFARR